MLKSGTQQRLVTGAQSTGLGKNLGCPFLFFTLDSLRCKFRRGTGLGCSVDVADGTRSAVADGADASAVFKQVLAVLRTALFLKCMPTELQVDRILFLLGDSPKPELGSIDAGS